MRGSAKLCAFASLAIACGGDGGASDEGGSGSEAGTSSTSASTSTVGTSSDATTPSTSADTSSESGTVCEDPGVADDECGACEACDAQHYCNAAVCSGDAYGGGAAALLGPWAVGGCVYAFDPLQQAAHIVVQHSCDGAPLAAAWDREEVAQLHAFAAGPDAAWWIEIDPDDDTFVVRAEEGSAPTVVLEEALPANAPIAVAADETRIVVLRGTPGGDVGLLQSPLDGSSWMIVGGCIALPAHDPDPDLDPDPRLVLTGDTAIFAMRYAAGRTIVACSLVGGDAIELATDGSGDAFDLAVDDAFLYYSGESGVARVPLAGGMAEHVADVLGRFAIADGTVLGADTHDVIAFEIASGTATVLVDNERPDDALAVADGALWWIGTRDGDGSHELRNIALP